MQVGQLSGYVAEHSAYHHGDVSLQGTIIGLAQEFVGSNNINVLDPNGQFGTRLQGGKDAASARYIFTNVATITRTLFHPADDNIVSYLNDDGQSIEPSWCVYYALSSLENILINDSCLTRVCLVQVHSYSSHGSGQRIGWYRNRMELFDPELLT